MDEYEILSETQTCFRKEYLRLDNIFTLPALMSEKKLKFCFIDFSRACHTIKRVGLFRKLLGQNSAGYQNNYPDIKFYLPINNQISAFLHVEVASGRQRYEFPPSENGYHQTRRVTIWLQVRRRFFFFKLKYNIYKIL